MEFIGIFLCILLTVAASVPMGRYIYRVMQGEKTLLNKILRPAEGVIYKLLKIEPNVQMTWKEYAYSVGILGGIGFIILFLILLIQGIPVLNPQGIKGMSWDMAFNTAASFVTNTNWQSYSGESQTTYLSQIFGLTVQNFISPAVGMSVLFAFIRGFSKEKSKELGNFWVDIIRSLLYVFIPLAIILAILLVTQGVVQNFSNYIQISILENVFPGNGTNITKQIIPQGPVASQIAIKQLGTNGGGFFGVNSAHPFENPTAFSNIIEMISIIFIPMSLCFSFGESIKDRRQGIAIFVAMFIMLATSICLINVNEKIATPQLSQNGTVDISNYDQSGGNMEGKESRIGTTYSSTWTALTTATANGSVNSMIDSYTPLGGMIAMLQMQLGEVIFGGVGCGLYNTLAFAIIAVFISGLMVGRTPEFLGKKIEPFEMKMAMFVCLVTPFTAIIGSTIACIIPGIVDNLSNFGPHGFSEILYAYSSAGANNGSAFAGLNANTIFLNISLGIIMIISRFVPILSVLACSGALAQKRKEAVGVGTLPTHNAFFIGLLIMIIIIIGALSFFPALALGPIAEFFQMRL